MYKAFSLFIVCSVLYKFRQYRQIAATGCQEVNERGIGIPVQNGMQQRQRKRVLSMFHTQLLVGTYFLGLNTILSRTASSGVELGC